METLFQYISPPSPCSYLPDQLWSLEYEIVSQVSAAEYMVRLRTGWRRFGNMLFRPRCRACQACQSLRIVAESFRPNRSQRRARIANEDEVQLVIGAPCVTRERLRLYDQYHKFQSSHKGWPEHPAKDEASYFNSFVANPFATEEWCFYLGEELVGVGYVDALSGGLSAIYFFYQPSHRHRSLGTWNVLRLIEECQLRNLPHLYLGYFVQDCPSLRYKADFHPNQVLIPDGNWVDFRV